jgi:ribosomal protein S12 methylthiotransferase accessory factor
MNGLHPEPASPRQRPGRGAQEPLRHHGPGPVLFRGKSHRCPKAFRSGTHRAQAPEETYRSIKPYLDRAGVTRIADVTGLDHIGVPTTLAIRPNALTMACSSGKGLTLDQAYVSGAMEAFELHAAETAVLPSIRASYRELSDRYPLPPATDLPLTRWSLFSPDWPFHWFLGWDLISQSEVPVPLALVGMSRDGALVASAGSFHVTSNGLGAGNSFLEAVAAGLYEVIERDAIACHFEAALQRGHEIPVVPESVLRHHPLVAGVLDRCDRVGVKVVVHECIVDTNVPTYSSLVYDQVDRDVGVVRGSGSHLDPEIAILRAVTEALQARLNFIAGSRDDIFRTAFVRMRADWGRTVRAIEAGQADCPRAPARASSASDTFEEDILQLLARVQAAGAQHVVVADLTPPDFPVHVVRVVIPGFEGYLHHGYRPGRRAASFASREGET